MLNRVALAAAASLIVFFHWRFAAWGLNAGLTFDDLMNMGRSVQSPIPESVREIILFWKPSYLLRPLPELVYRLMWEAFGPDPFPFRVLAHGLILLNAGLAFFVFRLVAPTAAALTVSLLLAHHPFLQSLYANTGFLFDLICFTFYFGALSVYLRTRPTAWYLIPWILALSSKEIAVTLPAVLTIWELTEGGTWTWLRARPLVAGHLLAAAFVFGRVLSPEGVSRAPGYETSYTISTFLTNGGDLLRQCFAARVEHPWLFAGAMLAMLACAVFLPEAKAARLGLAIAVVGALPILFLSNRVLPAAYLPFAGFLLALAASLYALLVLALRNRAIAGTILFLIAIRWLWKESVRWQLPPEIAFAENHRVEAVLDQIRALDLDLPKGARILMLEDPFADYSRWSSTFAFIILTGDSEIGVDWPNEGDSRPPYATVLTYSDGQIKRLE